MKKVLFIYFIVFCAIPLIAQNLSFSGSLDSIWEVKNLEYSNFKTYNSPFNKDFFWTFIPDNNSLSDLSKKQQENLYGTLQNSLKQQEKAFQFDLAKKQYVNLFELLQSSLKQQVKAFQGDKSWYFSNKYHILISIDAKGEIVRYRQKDSSVKKIGFQYSELQNDFGIKIFCKDDKDESIWIAYDRVILLYDVIKDSVVSYPILECGEINNIKIIDNQLCVNEIWVFNKEKRKLELAPKNNENFYMNEIFDLYTPYYNIRCKKFSDQIDIEFQQSIYTLKTPVNIYNTEDFLLEDSLIWLINYNSIYRINPFDKSIKSYKMAISEVAVLDNDKERIWFLKSNQEPLYVFDKKTHQWFALPNLFRLNTENRICTNTHLIGDDLFTLKIINKNFLWQKRVRYEDNRDKLSYLIEDIYKVIENKNLHDFGVFYEKVESLRQTILELNSDFFEKEFNLTEQVYKKIKSDSLMESSAIAYMSKHQLDKIYSNVSNFYIEKLCGQFDFKTSSIIMEQQEYEKSSLDFIQSVKFSLDSLTHLSVGKDTLLNFKGNLVLKINSTFQFNIKDSSFWALKNHFPNSFYYPIAVWRIKGACFYYSGMGKNIPTGSQNCIDEDLDFIRKYPTSKINDEVYEDLINNYTYLSDSKNLTEDYKNALFWNEKLLKEFPNYKKEEQEENNRALKNKIEASQWKLEVKTNKSTYKEGENVLVTTLVHRVPKDTTFYICHFPTMPNKEIWAYRFKLERVVNKDDCNRQSNAVKFIETDRSSRGYELRKFSGLNNLNYSVILNKKVCESVIGYYILTKGKYELQCRFDKLKSEVITFEVQ